MRKNRKSKMKKERMIMLASSALVMGALTLAGIYTRGQSQKQIDDGYSVDFSELENSVDNKVKEIAQAKQDEIPDPISDDALDYDPLAAGSDLIRIPGLTDVPEISDEVEKPEIQKPVAEVPVPDMVEPGLDVGQGTDLGFGEDTPVNEPAAVVRQDPVFNEVQGLTRPVSGETLMHYSMDSSIYFATLDQYKYNPAVVISATEGETITVCADGKVTAIYDDAKIGHAVVLDLGNGYQATYGQLKDVQAEIGAIVTRGAELGKVAAPTKYYSVEGPNLYFALTKDGSPVNPEALFH